MTESLLGIGLYTPADAARLLAIPTTTVHRWIEGYSFPLARWAARKRPPIFVPALPRIQGRTTLTFLDLIQLRVVKAFRDERVPLQRIRTAALTAGPLFGTSHPLAHLRFKTDGRSVWSDVINRSDREILDLSSGGQSAFAFVEQSLREIRYATHDRLANRWLAAGPGGGIVVDPRISFGAPVVDEVFVPTSVIWEQARTERDPERLASWFRLDVKHVHDALRFEEQLAHAA